MNEPGNVANTATKPYKEMQFNEFLHQIGNSNVQNWSMLAEGLGVDRATITRWKDHPLAKQALETAINDSLRKMEQAGDADWKMHREKLKMLGIKDKTTLEHEFDGEQLKDVLDTLEKKTDYAELGQKIAEQSMAHDAPVQDQKQAGSNSSVSTECDSATPSTTTA